MATFLSVSDNKCRGHGHEYGPGYYHRQKEMELSGKNLVVGTHLIEEKKIRIKQKHLPLFSDILRLSRPLTFPNQSIQRPNKLGCGIDLIRRRSVKTKSVGRYIRSESFF